jgi:hypothetical protein
MSVSSGRSWIGVGKSSSHHLTQDEKALFSTVIWNPIHLLKHPKAHFCSCSRCATNTTSGSRTVIVTEVPSTANWIRTEGAPAG